MDAVWHISPCPFCAGLIKLPKVRRDGTVICPRCGASIDLMQIAEESTAAAVPAEEAETTSEREISTLLGQRVARLEGASPNALPEERSFNPEPVRLRGKEGWQALGRPLRDVEADFKDRLQKTTDPELLKDPNEDKGIRVKKNRQFGGVPSVTGWDEEARAQAELAAVEKRAKERRRFWRRVPWGLVAMFAGLMVTALFLSFRNYFRHPDPGEKMAPLETGPTVAPENPYDLLEKLATMDYLPEVNQTVKRFAEAPNPESLRSLIREPERVMPLLEAYYRDRTPYAPIHLRRMATGVEGDVATHKRFVCVTLEDVNFVTQVLTLEKTSTGFKVDWESFVGLGDMTLEEFQRQRPTSPVFFRLILGDGGSYYADDFPDKNTHGCFSIKSSLDGATQLFGYVEFNSPVFDKLANALVLHRDHFFCMARLKYPEHSTNPRQVEIAEFISSGWINRNDGPQLPVPGKAATPSQGQSP